MESIEKKLLIYVDILGFDQLPKDIEKVCKIQASKVRYDFVNVIKNRITESLSKGEIVAQNFGNRDDWVLVCESIDSVFKTITTILDHRSSYVDFEKIPLEFAVGLGYYPKGANLDNERLVDENFTIQFLKTPIIKSYH
jgi:hypothetical protein